MYDSHPERSRRMHSFQLGSFFPEIKKILEVDYPRGRAKEYYANFISAKSLKIEFSLFHPSV
ncbi:MAG: hypothetical protein ACK5HT_21025, partial [Draconibacterium sp.]